MSEATSTTGRRTLRLGSFRFWIALCIVLTLVTGMIGYWQVDPTLEPDELLYRAVVLFAMNYSGPAVGAPLALRFARFIAVLVTFSTVVAFVRSAIGRQGALAKARLARAHTVVLGTAPEAAPLAIDIARHSRAAVVAVGQHETAQALQLRREGVLVVPVTTQQHLRAIVSGADQVIVAGAADDESALLAGRVAELTGNAAPRTLVLFERPEVAQAWPYDAREQALCKPRQLAVATLRERPPRLEDALVPPPIVIGDGGLATELVRRIVVGWQQPGERMTVHCVAAGPESWLADAALGLDDRAELTRTIIAPVPDEARRAVSRLRSESRVPPLDRATVSGPSIYVALSLATRGVPIAIDLAEAFPEARVTTIVDDDATWAHQLAGLAHPPLLISRREQLGDRRILCSSRTDLLAEELVADAGRWPQHVPGAFGPMVGDESGGAPARLADQPEGVRAAITQVAQGAEAVLAAGGVQVGGPHLDDTPAFFLSPAELAAMRDKLVPLIGASPAANAADLPLRTLELASRLPVLAARAGWPVHRATHYDDALTADEVARLAQDAHAAYQRLAAQTGNATGSSAADESWHVLSEFNKASNRAQIMDAPVKLALAGLDWRRVEHPEVMMFSDELVERLAEYEHRRWEHYQRRNGRPGHTWAKPWAELTDDVREYDRSPVRALPTVLASVGLEITEAISRAPGPTPS